jgi:hypothetical protein
MTPQSFFIDSTDGILKVFTTPLPKEPKLMFTPVEQYKQLRTEYEQAIELAKKEAVKIDDSQQDYLKKRIYDADPGRNTGVDTYFVNENEIFTINMEEEIKVVDIFENAPQTPENLNRDNPIAGYMKKVARINPKKADSKFKPSDFRIGEKVHHKIYPRPHGEIFTVVGIKEDEIALKGDWSGGVRPIDAVSWVKYDEVIKKAEESEDADSIISALLKPAFDADDLFRRGHHLKGRKIDRDQYYEILRSLRQHAKNNFEIKRKA